jgi:hypothetical protein
MFESLLDRLASRRHAEDRRQPEPREAVAWAATIEVDGRNHPIEIGNISTGGLMARSDIEVAPETGIAVWIDGRRLTGEVRWYGDGRFGMRFDEPMALDAEVVARYRPANVETSKAMSRWMI